MLMPYILYAQAVENLPPAGPAPAPGFGEVIQRMLPMFLVVFAIFYFMILRPQQQKLKAQQALYSGLKKGDSVLTSSGIFAKVAAIEKDYVLLEIANNVRIKCEMQHISRKIEKPLAEKATSS